MGGERIPVLAIETSDPPQTSRIKPRRLAALAGIALLAPAVAVLLAKASPPLGLAAGLLTAAVGAWAAFRPFSQPLPITRPRAVLLLWFALWSLLASGAVQANNLERLAAEAPDKYLEHIKRSRSDAEWLSALKELRPDQYAQEIGRREAKRRQEQAEAAERQAAVERARREGYPLRIDAALSEIRTIDLRHLSKESAFSLFASWALLIDEGRSIQMNEAARVAYSKLKAEASAFQVKTLPILRAAHAAKLRDIAWESDMAVRVFGPGNTTVEYVWAGFAANRNVKAFSDKLDDVHLQLRFKRVQFKWFEGADKLTYYEPKPPVDRDIVIWTGKSFRRVD